MANSKRCVKIHNFNNCILYNIMLFIYVIELNIISS